MSTENKPTEAPAPATTKSTLASRIDAALRVVLPAVLAAAAAYGGTRAAAAQPQVPVMREAPKDVAPPPGPTLPLDPFVVTLLDASRRPHPMRMSIAIEFNELTKTDLKTLVPRVRDAMLSHLRTLTFEDMGDPAFVDKLRGELLARCRGAGAPSAEHILVTDLVVQ